MTVSRNLRRLVRPSELWHRANTSTARCPNPGYRPSAVDPSAFRYARPDRLQCYLSTQSLPIILQPSFWRSLMPKALRSGSTIEPSTPRPKSKEWNPATFFIVIFILIGSQAIQMIALQKDFVQFSHQTEAKLALLRDVVKRVQNGEDVDVEGLLGTGNKAREKEWEEVMRELEEEDALIQSRRQRRKKAKEAAENATHAPPNELQHAERN